LGFGDASGAAKAFEAAQSCWTFASIAFGWYCGSIEAVLARKGEIIPGRIRDPAGCVVPGEENDMNWKTGWGAAMALALACPAFAVPVGVVEAVQYPAWIDRNGRAEPLKPGMALEAKDALRTGDDGRVRMKLGEGSTVKVGAKASFVVEKVQPTGGVFRATLEVASGAFRFTTDPARKDEKREIEVKALNATAGIRGTDLWGKSTPERTFVVLIEGKIEVGSPGNPTVTLDKPLDYYDRRAGIAPSVQRMEASALEAYARETEMGDGGPVATPEGRWQVVAAVLADRGVATIMNDGLRSLGFPTEMADGPRGEVEVVVSGLAGQAEARALATSLRKVKGIATPVVRAMR
jgi:hypothetical protein